MSLPGQLDRVDWCRRGDACTRSGCRFAHSAAEKRDRPKCAFGARCRNLPYCTFAHPPSHKNKHSIVSAAEQEERDLKAALEASLETSFAASPEAPPEPSPEAPPETCKPCGNASECGICFEEAGKLAAMVPCGHVVCTDCAHKLKRCAFCEADVQSVLRIFL